MNVFVGQVSRETIGTTVCAPDATKEQVHDIMREAVIKTVAKAAAEGRLDIRPMGRVVYEYQQFNFNDVLPPDYADPEKDRIRVVNHYRYDSEEDLDRVSTTGTEMIRASQEEVPLQVRLQPSIQEGTTMLQNEIDETIAEIPAEEGPFASPVVYMSVTHDKQEKTFTITTDITWHKTPLIGSATMKKRE